MWFAASFSQNFGKKLPLNYNNFGTAYGLLFRSKTIANISRLIYDHFDHAPLDWLVGSWVTAHCHETNRTNTQCFPHLRVFQHQGKVSSKGKNKKEFDDAESWLKIGCDEEGPYPVETISSWGKRIHNEFLKY